MAGVVFRQNRSRIPARTLPRAARIACNAYLPHRRRTPTLHTLLLAIHLIGPYPDEQWAFLCRFLAEPNLRGAMILPIRTSRYRYILVPIPWYPLPEP